MKRDLSKSWRNGPAVLILVLLVTLAAHCFTLTRSPVVWQDEVQIVDYGRCLANPETSWGLSIDAEGRPGIGTSLYEVIQYQWLRATGVTPFAVRFLSSLCAVGAVLLFYGLLRSQDITPTHATIISLALWFDPLLLRTFRTGRADSFALLVCFAACWAWHGALKHNSVPKSIGAGVGAALAMLSWPTAAVTLVLGIYFYFEAAWGRRRLFLRCLAFAFFGFVLAFLCYLAFICSFLPFDELIDRIVSVRRAESACASEERVDLGKPVLVTIPKVVFESYARSPWVLVWMVAACVLAFRGRRNLGLLLAIVGAMGIASSAGTFYFWRLLYVMPLFYLFIGRAFSSLRVSWALVLLLVVPSMIINLGLRSAITFAEWNQRDYGKFARELTELIPPGEVVVGYWVHYYAGLDQEWQMYELRRFERIAQRFDSFYVIVPCWRDTPTYLKDWNIECVGVIDVLEPFTKKLGLVPYYYDYDVRVYLCTRGGNVNDSQ